MLCREPKYPLFADLNGASVCVVGAGAVAERKIEALLACGASITVIAPWAAKRITALAEQGALVWEQRAYCTGDAQKAFVVIGATDSPRVNEQVYEEAKSAGHLVNVVDAPALCNFYVPSVVRRGPLQIAISTSGAAPTVAKQLRHELAERYGEEWGAYVLLLGEVRSLILERAGGGEEAHKPLFSMLANSDLYERVASGEELCAEGVYEEKVLPFLREAAGAANAPAAHLEKASGRSLQEGEEVVRR